MGQLGKGVCGTEPSRDWLSRQGGAGSAPRSRDLHGSWRGRVHLLFLCAPGCAPGLCPRWALLLLCLPPLSKFHSSLRTACIPRPRPRPVQSRAAALPSFSKPQTSLGTHILFYPVQNCVGCLAPRFHPVASTSGPRPRAASW